MTTPSPVGGVACSDSRNDETDTKRRESQERRHPAHAYRKAHGDHVILQAMPEMHIHSSVQDVALVVTTLVLPLFTMSVAILLSWLLASASDEDFRRWVAAKHVQLPTRGALEALFYLSLVLLVCSLLLHSSGLSKDGMEFRDNPGMNADSAGVGLFFTSVILIAEGVLLVLAVKVATSVFRVASERARG